MKQIIDSAKYEAKKSSTGSLFKKLLLFFFL